MTQSNWFEQEPTHKIEKTVYVPSLNWNLDEQPDLEFPNAWRATNEELQRFLTMYGNYKSYLEYALADKQSRAHALADQYDELMAVNMYMFVKKNTDAKRMVKEQVKGAVIDSDENIQKHIKELRNVESECKRLEGLLASYTTAYNTISRIISLRVTK